MKRTILYNNHLEAGGKMVEFAGWEMPIQYPTGILKEHLLTRREAGIFDVSHMGRFIVKGEDALPFLQHVLTNNAEALTPGKAQYTMISDENGYAVDDAYLYRFLEEEYLLVVNAANFEKDRKHLMEYAGSFKKLTVTDVTDDMAMISLQGPNSRDIILSVLPEKHLPDPRKNECAVYKVDSRNMFVARTGYTGEPIGFEIFADSKVAPRIWKDLTVAGAHPVGLGARDSLRLEAGLPLYGHELGKDPGGGDIPIYACPLAKFAVSFNPNKGDFVGRKALLKQFEEFRRVVDHDYRDLKHLDRIIKPVAVKDRGVVRGGAKVFRNGEFAGWVTSGTVIPYWETEGTGTENRLTDESDRRAITLALIDVDLEAGDQVEVESRNKSLRARVVKWHLRSEAPPYARSILPPEPEEGEKPPESGDIRAEVDILLRKAVDNTRWRSEECINLIPSEMTASPMARLLSVMDPSFRYAEHKAVKALGDAEVFYYQGTGFIHEVEEKVKEEFIRFLGCKDVEPRVVSGQMANAAFFSAMVDYINRADRKSEQRRMRSVMNNHIIRGGHLSAQPMGALRDYVARDPRTEKPAVVNFPVEKDNPYKIDVEKTADLLEAEKPELIILGKSMIIHKEPVAEIRRMVDDLGLDSVIMYDMAHVLGLVGPYFQDPFKEGAHVVTGSTHKTFFGTQRGIIAGSWDEEDEDYPLWEAVERRTFPGSVSNHHLGTLLGLLISCYEMNEFKDEYQKAVVDNAKSFAQALSDRGFEVAGDPSISYTETHQVIVKVGYGKSVDIAGRLEDNNIICNYQASPEEEGFTASGSLRLGVSEMTRFGFGPEEFARTADFMKAVVLEGKEIGRDVASWRRGYTDLKYCFTADRFSGYLETLHDFIR